MLTINDIDLKCGDAALLLDFISREFTKLDENITPLKILSKFGFSSHDQQNQLKFKNITKKIKVTLLRLEEQGMIELKDALHSTLGIKEKAYKLKL